MAFSTAQAYRCDPAQSSRIGLDMFGELPELPANAESIAFRQLRHQTKNALQKLICEVARHAERQSVAAEAQDGMKSIFVDLERRICLTARVSDALFGFTTCPGPIDRRLRALATSMIGLLAAEDQTIDCQVNTEGACPDALAETIVRVAHEMLGNAIKHGLAGRKTGAIRVRLLCTLHQVRLQVIDDGLGPDGAPSELALDGGTGAGAGEGFALMRELTGAMGGRVSLTREAHRTVAELRMPIARHRTAQPLAMPGAEATRPPVTRAGALRR